MSVLSTAQRLHVLAGLVDGNSERAIERMTGVTRKTIGGFALKLGTAAQSLHNTMAHDLSCSVIENDEVWSYVKKKQSRVTPAENAAGLGEAYAFTAVAMPSRYVVTWKVGKRDETTAAAFIADLRARLAVLPAMTSDGFPAYVAPIAKRFGYGIDYAQIVKNYQSGGTRDDDHRYEPPRDPFITKRAIFGAPDLDKATTAHNERNNGTMRHKIGRMRRLCYAFSKSPEHHKAAVALGYVHYNLAHVLRTTRVTPAMAVGVTDHIWELEELLDALLSVPATPAPRTRPLTARKPEGTSRELPGGRGYLRVVRGAKSAPPEPRPETPPPAPMAAADPSVEASAVASAAPVDDRQLDLFAWKPKPREPHQLNLFGDPDPVP
jgi:IS1 family transposase